MTSTPATASSGTHGWGGYKVHFTETCDAPGTRRRRKRGQRDAGHRQEGRGDRPNLITGVATTEATVADAAMTTPVHQQLEERRLLPGEHLVDSGYPSAELIIARRPRLRDHAGQPAAAGQLRPGQGRRRV